MSLLYRTARLQAKTSSFAEKLRAGLKELFSCCFLKIEIQLIYNISLQCTNR